MCELKFVRQLSHRTTDKQTTRLNVKTSIHPADVCLCVCLCAYVVRGFGDKFSDRRSRASSHFVSLCWNIVLCMQQERKPYSTYVHIANLTITHSTQTCGYNIEYRERSITYDTADGCSPYGFFLLNNYNGQWNERTKKPIRTGHDVWKLLQQAVHIRQLDDDAGDDAIDLLLLQNILQLSEFQEVLNSKRNFFE